MHEAARPLVAIRGGSGARQPSNPHTSHACSRSESWLPEPTHRSCLTLIRPLMCYSPRPLSQRLASLVENPLLLTPGACRGLDVHRFDGRRALRVTTPCSVGWGSLSSQCCLSCRPFVMAEFLQPLRAPPLPRIRRPRRSLLHRQRVRCRCLPRRRGAATIIVAMAKRRKRKRYVHAVYVDGPHTLALRRQPDTPGGYPATPAC